MNHFSSMYEQQRLNLLQSIPLTFCQKFCTRDIGNEGKKVRSLSCTVSSALWGSVQIKFSGMILLGRHLQCPIGLLLEKALKSK